MNSKNNITGIKIIRVIDSSYIYPIRIDNYPCGTFLSRFLIIKQMLFSLMKIRHSLLLTLNRKGGRKLPLLFIVHRDAQKALYKFGLLKNSLTNKTKEY